MKPTTPSEPARIRLAVEGDDLGVLGVYAPYLDTPITFECDEPSPAEFRERMARVRTFYPYLVAELAGGIVGFAYAHRQAGRAAYGWNVELSAYLAPGRTGGGIGSSLYAALIELVRLQGAKAAYALVTVPNEASEHLHEAFGFERIGLQPKAGWKADAWHDVAWLRKELAPYDGKPEPLVAFPELAAARPEAVQSVLDRANAQIAAQTAHSGRRG